MLAARHRRRVSDGARDRSPARAAIAAEAPDPRLASLLPPLAGNGQTGVDWVLGLDASESDAERALRDDYAAAASAAGAGAPTPSPPGAIDGPTAYLLGTVETVETAPVFVGDDDNPVICGANGQTLTITNNWVADVTFHELNATATLAPTPPPSGEGLCHQLADDVAGSAKYESAPRIKRVVPNALVAGACVAVKLVKPNTPAPHKRVFVEAFKVKVNLLRAGGSAHRGAGSHAQEPGRHSLRDRSRWYAFTAARGII